MFISNISKTGRNTQGCYFNFDNVEILQTVKFPNCSVNIDLGEQFSSCLSYNNKSKRIWSQ